MKKIKKYVYPFVFVIISFIYLILASIVISLYFSGDLSGLGIIFIAVLLLLLIILPIYCVKYSKIIQDEKFRVLFAFYNAFVIIGSYMLPLIEWTETYGYGIVFFIWTLFWSILLLKPRIKPCEEENNPSKEKLSTATLLLQNKKKNIIAIIFTCLYIINIAEEPMVWQMHDINYILIFTLPLFSAFIVLVFLFLKNTEYLLKKWLLSFAFAGELIRRLFSIFLSISSMDVQLKYNPLYPIIFVFSCLMVILIAIMFIGTLFDFKYIKLLKYGTLCYVILSVCLLIFNLVNVGGTAYHQIDSNGTLAINISYVIASLVEVLYYTGILIITTNKANKSIA